LEKSGEHTPTHRAEQKQLNAMDDLGKSVHFSSAKGKQRLPEVEEFHSIKTVT